MILYRPVGRAELDLIIASNYKSFPPRLPSQPFFYPVCNQEYAIQIARDWNAKREGFGAVLRFEVLDDYINKYSPQTVGSRTHQEYWIPAEALDEFNANLQGPIEVIDTF